MILILDAHIVLDVPCERISKEKKLPLYASIRLRARELNLPAFLSPVTKSLLGCHVSAA